ncbi:MAG: hypothetical protein KDE62_02055, partial [Calditrichaeota bacterium]|nr:hypothetical protein [Calditrichota bacterium]MCB0312882.1 hypothetical protein [Calditrichota bacterium]
IFLQRMTKFISFRERRRVEYYLLLGNFTRKITAIYWMKHIDRCRHCEPRILRRGNLLQIAANVTADVYIVPGIVSPENTLQ